MTSGISISTKKRISLAAKLIEIASLVVEIIILASKHSGRKIEKRVKRFAAAASRMKMLTKPKKNLMKLFSSIGKSAASDKLK